MALNWNFKTDKIGTWEYSVDKGGERYTKNLYSGNALLIAVYETDDEYIMGHFYCDKEHMKNCLGLGDDKCNIHNFERDVVVTLRKDYRGTKDIVNALIKAKFEDGITIRIVEEV